MNHYDTAIERDIIKWEIMPLGNLKISFKSKTYFHTGYLQALQNKYGFSNSHIIHVKESFFMRYLKYIEIMNYTPDKREDNES